jgi:acyl-CoA dehydrogenase
MEETLIYEELALIRSTVKRFVEKEVVKLELDVGSLAEELPSERVALLKAKGKQMGLWMMGAKNEWGGAELDLFSRVVLMEEMAQHRFGLLNPAAGAFGRELPGFLKRVNNPTLLDEFINPAVVSGNGCFLALGEQAGGFGYDQLSVTAVKAGSQWKLNGVKKYVPNVEEADFGIVLANCIESEQEEAYRPTLFIVPKNLVSYKEMNMLKDIKTYDITFEHTMLSDEMRIGDVGNGLDFVQVWLDEEQLLMSARCLGIAKKAIMLTIDWVLDRTVFGKKLAERPVTQGMLADSEIELNAARFMVWNAAKKITDGSAQEVDAGMAKAFATETAFRIIDRCVQIHGGMGVAQELPLERWYRELRIARLELMSTDAIKEKVAQTMLKRSKGVVKV